MMPELYSKTQDCCGCQACGNACPVDAISYVENDYGFLYPKIDAENCMQCGRCASVCDFHKQEREIQRNYPLACYAAVNRNKKTLETSASGGVFTALAEIILEQNGAVFGCAFDSDLIPRHTCATSREEIIPMSGSKYVQSNVGFSYREVKRLLNEGKKVLFTGTPCQIAALRAFLGDRAQAGLLTLEVICHGTPSTAMFKSYIAFVERKYHTHIVAYSFRSKNNGWGMKDYSFDQSFVQSNGKKRTVPAAAAAAYMVNYRSNNLHRDACFACKYSSPERAADITMGDFWGYKNVGVTLPSKKGLSVMFLNTQKAVDLLPQIAERMELEQICDIAAAIECNGNMHRPSPRGDRWGFYMESFREGKAEMAFERYGIENRRLIQKRLIINAIPMPVLNAVLRIKWAIKGKN